MVYSKEVIGMFAHRKKVGNVPDAVKLTERLIRLLRSDAGFQASPINPESAHQEEAYDEHQGEIVNAMLEGEYQKAKAIVAMHQHRGFC